MTGRGFIRVIALPKDRLWLPHGLLLQIAASGDEHGMLQSQGCHNLDNLDNLQQWLLVGLLMPSVPVTCFKLLDGRVEQKGSRDCDLLRRLSLMVGLQEASSS